MKKYILFILLIICNCGIVLSQEVSEPEEPVPGGPGGPVGPEPSEPNMITHNWGLLTAYSAFQQSLYTECMFIYNDYTSFEDAIDFEVDGVIELNFTFTNQSEYDCLLTLSKMTGDIGSSVIKNYSLIKGTEKTEYIVLDAGKYQIRPATPCGYKGIDIEEEVTPLSLTTFNDEEYVGPDNLGRKGPYTVRIQTQKNVTFNFSGGRNYINTRTYTNETGIDFIDQIQYFDGLGRLSQTVQRGITPNKGDLISLQEYDSYGRQSNTWLPALSAQNGAFVDEPEVKNAAIQLNNDQKPYAKSIYENSPLNRVTAQFGPGADWHNAGNAVRTGYLTNDNTKDSLKCILYKVNGTGTVTSLVNAGYYANSTLLVTRVTDEEGHLAYEFKDKLGQVLLTRTVAEEGYLDTYYVYDKAGNLCYVLPPLAAGTAQTGDNSDALLRYAYLYKYDNLHRCIAKRIPGSEWIYYVYDRADNLIFTQDGEQRKDGKNEWSFAIPDAHGRIALTGICKNTINYAVNPLDNAIVRALWANATNTYKGYNITGISLTNPQVLTVNYYDNYEFLGKNSIPDNNDSRFTGQDGYGDRYTGSNKGLLTGTLTAQLGGQANSPLLYTVMYYDSRGRMVQAKANNHLNGTDWEYVAYNFTNQPLKRMNVHKAQGKPDQTETYEYNYDHAGRLLSTQHSLNNNTPVILARNSYNELGQLSGINRGGSGLITGGDDGDIGVDDDGTAIEGPEVPTETATNIPTNYAYNVRSWTTAITGEYFSQNLQHSPGGNITRMDWTTDGQNRSYDFEYDRLSRLKKANYTGIGNEQYGTQYTYDKHGNIMTLKRSGKTDSSYGLVDNLKMNYTGNQLTKVTDTGVNVNLTSSADFKNHAGVNGLYTYNKNGAMDKDTHKGILGISYNSLNLPQELTVKTGRTSGKVYYTYSAGGIKLRTKHLAASNPAYTPMHGTTAQDASLDLLKETDYIGNKIYENGSLKMIVIDGGYIQDGQYYFYLTDHLGNNRVVVDKNGTVIQKNHYYPFGMAFAETLKAEQGLQPYKYNGKELDQMHELNLIDYSARYMEPATGRFTTVDPLAEKYYSISPYAYVANNPLKFIDPTGMWIYVYHGGQSYKYEDGQLYQYEKGKYNEYTVLPGSVLEGILNGLNDLFSNSRTGAWLVNYFSNDKRDISIKSLSRIEAQNMKLDYKNQIDMTNNIIYLKDDLSGSEIPTENGIQMSPFWLDIGHELGHGVDLSIRGLSKAMEPWKMIGDDGRQIPNTETISTHYENFIRAEANLPLRTHYDKTKIGGGYIIVPYAPSWILDSSGKGRYSGVQYRQKLNITIPEYIKPRVSPIKLK
ncbi:RHS repeat-associated protein [Dysgonomonas sp. PFB1-18]|uniref:DUF6443 domain-containing protein n=1 Tax=unclassified Dysgonomonas TaxID=2630389 RepID=UPI002475B300|nr:MULTISPECIES: DUF6443 domain-containing protein [unclassified Dysgonomonas]MDH6309444.1 RHS repeat-associated protein [Dysgonomonas sp. PF1-14]MDH6339691.1 RHS repeat-associated protein [Dysgonomonas sp. PF1-16]MDH6381339.1 RHS repeat-associated protein [Dysgonomonas sp. PFB1-18]MDH6398554.1 RHS repeat-associated protein [Dysgonomonas sp. PF1-23]